MPGIAGILAKSPRVEVSRMVAQSVAALHHDAEADFGQVDFPDLGLAVGWSVPRGAYAGCLPIWNEARNVCLVFHGEHFGDVADRSSRPAATAQSEARGLMERLESSEAGFLASLNGAFNGLIVDLRAARPRITLFNDRFGLGRLYWHEDANGFYFATEAKALLRILPHLRALDPQALAEWFACGCTLENRSLFAGVSLLPPGSAWQLAPAGPVVRTAYFEPREWEASEPMAADAYQERFSELFTQIVPPYAAGRRPAALSVTGGVDSRMVMASLRPAPGTLPCYTFGGLMRECADVRIGRQVAAATGQSHQVIPVTEAFFGRFSELAARCVYLTDGVMDASGAVSLFLNAAARALAPVRLTGNFGGEILRSMLAIKASRGDPSLFAGGFDSFLEQVPATVARVREGHPLTAIAFRQVPWLHFAMHAVESSQVTVRTPFLDNRLIALAYRAPVSFRLNKNPAFRYIADTDPRLIRIPTDRGTLWSPDTPAEAKRSRWRWLREEFLPKAEYAYDYGMPRWLVRVDRALAPLHLEKLFLGHQKFAHHRLWYRHRLAGQIREILLDHESLNRPHLNPRRVTALVEAHLAGRENHTLALHKLLGYELIHRTLLAPTP